MTGGWIGVDLDGTLAVDEGHTEPDQIGPPVPAMAARVRRWLRDGEDVRIFTARVYAPLGDRERAQWAHLARMAITKWCKEHFGKALPITCMKDYKMRVLYDDRARQVEKNTGRVVEGPRR